MLIGRACLTRVVVQKESNVKGCGRSAQCLKPGQDKENPLSLDKKLILWSFTLL
jgi:hypothetical protein